MKENNTSKFMKKTSIFLALLVLFNSFGYELKTQKNGSTSTTNTGEEYFNAIYFKKGPLAKAVYKGELDNLIEDNYSEQQKIEVAEIQQMIYNSIIKSNPRFISEFKSGIESNDLLTIESTIKRGSKLISETFQSMDKKLLEKNKVYQTYSVGYEAASTPSEKQACLIYQLCTLQGLIFLVMDMGIVVAYSSILNVSEEKARLYKEQFVYNVYELQKQ
ncbi:MAG: hypothetical protein J0L86_03490 [Flavobacteriales bacterium]|nr:hypothetical protein [Flavobacteriales bacterium]